MAMETVASTAKVDVRRRARNLSKVGRSDGIKSFNLGFFPLPQLEMGDDAVRKWAADARRAIP